MYKKYNYLCEDSKRIRNEVFTQEQGFVNEFDNIDDIASHIVFYDNNKAYGVCRYFKDDTLEYHIGRIAIIKSYRKRNLGNYIMKVAEENIIKDGGKRIVLSAQLQAKGFYERNGYISYGEAYLDEHCIHINMKKDLSV